MRTVITEEVLKSYIAMDFGDLTISCVVEVLRWLKSRSAFTARVKEVQPVEYEGYPGVGNDNFDNTNPIEFVDIEGESDEEAEARMYARDAASPFKLEEQVITWFCEQGSVILLDTFIDYLSGKEYPVVFDEFLEEGFRVYVRYLIMTQKDVRTFISVRIDDYLIS